MLKDALGKLLETQNSRQDCKLGRIVSGLDGDTADALLQVLKSDITTMSLVRTLNSEGISIGREFLGEKRNTCLKDPEAAKTCCLRNQIGAKNGK